MKPNRSIPNSTVIPVLIYPDVRQAVDWLGPVQADFAAGEPGPVPPYASNTMRTLRALYILADRGVRPEWNQGRPMALAHRDAVLQRLAGVLALVAPMAG